MSHQSSRVSSNLDTYIKIEFMKINKLRDRTFIILVDVNPQRQLPFASDPNTAPISKCFF